MKSQQFSDYGQSFSSNEKQTPAARGDQVLIRVTACGVCHSDVHLWEGHFDLGGGHKIDLTQGRELPFTLGHEIAGIVEEVGEDVEGISVGDPYVVYPWIGCGKCDICDRGMEHLCNRPQSLGVTVDGGFSDHVMVPHSRYLFDYGSVSADVACTYGCSGVTAYSALHKVRLLVQGKTLLLIGAGGVGLAGLAIARTILDCEIIVSDISAEKRQVALDSGADAVIDPLDRDASKALIKRTRGGVMAAVDFVGSDKSAAFGMGLLNKGGSLVIVGLFGGAMNLSVPLLPLKSITISGSFVGSLQDMGDLMKLVRAGKLDALSVTDQPLSCAGQAIENLRDGKVIGRVVLKPE